jgi:hypothetical protein
MFEMLELTWTKLGSKGRRDCVVTIALSIQEHIAKKTTLVLTPGNAIPDQNAIRTVLSTIDTVYSGIAEEAKKYVLEKPVMSGLTKAAAEQMPKPKGQHFSSTEKLKLSYALL